MKNARRMSGLQIDPRCVKCHKENRVDVVLYELRNHTYICNHCYQAEIQQGKTPQLAHEMPVASPQGLPFPPVPRQPGVNGSGKTEANPQPLSSTQPLSPGIRRTAPLRLPPDSLYAMLELPLTATATEIERAIQQKMRYLMQIRDAQERKRWNDVLQEWQDIADDPERLSAYQSEMQRAMMPRQSNKALSVGGRLVSNAQEFLAACEGSQDGWSDGVRYLRNGRLKQWIFYQVDRKLAERIAFYQMWQISDFRSLNEALYYLVPTRPFRLYAKDEWQNIANVPSAATPSELAALCDKYWQLGERHLYEGSMLYWLEQSHHIPNLQSYFQENLDGRNQSYYPGSSSYERYNFDRGVGLELLLERAVPSLPRPELVVTFDGNLNAYTLGPWDRELSHQPVTMQITNRTRGYVSLSCELDGAKIGEPNWLMLNGATSVTLQTSSEKTRTITRSLSLNNLSALERGHTYRRTLTLTMRGERNNWSKVDNFPITLKTMNSFQGLYGKLWLWGLRGGLPGLFWSFLAGFVLAYIPFLFTSAVPIWIQPDPAQVVPALLQWTAIIIQSPIGIPRTFPLIVGAIMGISGFFAAIGQGHIALSEQQNRSQFGKWTTWLTLIASCSLLIFIGNTRYLLSGIFAGTVYADQFFWGIVITCVLIFILKFIIGRLRLQLERRLRTRYEGLLHLPGRG